MLKLSLSLMLLTIISGCSTLEIVHAPLQCMGQPSIGVKFTQEEAASMEVETVGKIVSIRETYKARIDAICREIDNHNKLHEGD